MGTVVYRQLDEIETVSTALRLLRSTIDIDSNDDDGCRGIGGTWPTGGGWGEDTNKRGARRYS